MATSKFKQFRMNLRRKLRDGFAEAREDVSRSRLWVRLGGLALALYLVLAVGLGIYWSSAPEIFDVEQTAQRMLDDKNLSSTKGATIAATQIAVVETLLGKTGGYLSNDIAPPGIWLDNMPSWEYGVVIQVRDMSKAMREAFSRSQSQSLEDKDLALAESRFNFNTDSWFMPATENQYRDGVDYVHRYLERLAGDADGNASFYSRADSLHYWLSTVGTRLGSLSQRLTASVGQRRLNTDMAVAGEQDVAEVIAKTPWTELDDVFHEARGSAWALIHFLKAAEVDFADVLEDKNARVSLQQIIRELESTQRAIYSPVILNGSGFGLLANHSLAMSSYISRANASLIDLRRLLEQG